MDNLEAQLGAVLGNPEAMQKIMALAQNLNLSGSADTPGRQEQNRQASAPPEQPELDLSMLQKISGLAGTGRIDKNEQSLLKALHPYLTGERIAKLERAMRAAKLAKAASAIFGSGILRSGSGR